MYVNKYYELVSAILTIIIIFWTIFFDLFMIKLQKIIKDDILYSLSSISIDYIE